MTDEFQGKSFSITDPQGVNTVIYRINRTAKELQKQYPKYTVERLVYSEEMNGNAKKKTFYVDYPEPEIIGGDMQYPWYLTVKYSVTDRDDNLLYIYMFESKEETQTNVDIFENTTQDFFKKFNRLR